VADETRGCGDCSRWWRREDEAFAEQFAEARADAADNLEREAMRRAVQGVERPVIYRGEVASAWVDGEGNYVPKGSPQAAQLVPLAIREYSDTLLIFLLKAARPEKYRERRHSTMETPSAPSMGPPLLARAMNDPTIHRLTAEILAALDVNEASP
jgi:hypothetical protein